MSKKLKAYFPPNATEVTIHLGWDIGDGSNSGYTARLYFAAADQGSSQDSIILDDSWSDFSLQECVENFSTEYLPQEYHNLNSWKFDPEKATCQIPFGYFLDIEPPKESPKIRSQRLSSANAESGGYALWNDCDHLCVDVPDGVSTISCRLSNGRTMTFGFVPYELNGVPQCVDIRDLGDPLNDKMRTGSDQYRQNLIGFSGGGTAFRTSKLEKLTTLVTLLFKTGESK